MDEETTDLEDITVISEEKSDPSWNYKDATWNTYEMRTSEFLRALSKETRYDSAQISLEDTEIMSVFQSSDSIGLSFRENRGFPLGTRGIAFMDLPLMTEILLEYTPDDFPGIVRAISLCRGNNAWNARIKKLLKSGEIKPAHLITCREDCYELFLRYGIAQDDAEALMNNIRKGKGLYIKGEYQENRLLAAGLPTWIMDSLKAVHYLPMRTHSIMEAQCSWRIAYYKVHYPQEFYKTFFNMYADDYDMENILQGYEKVTDAIWKLDKSSRNGHDYDMRKRRHFELALEMFARGIQLPEDSYQKKGYVTRNLDRESE